MTEALADTPARRLRSTLGLILCRLIVPAWICTGALFKLLEANPGLLPRGLLKDAHALGINLDTLLAALISLECLVALVILFVGRFARAMAIFMMSVFAIVLIREIASGNTSCGCLGASSPSPWVMLIIDGGLLLGLIVLKPGSIPVIDRARWPIAVAAVLALAATGTSFATLTSREAAPVAVDAGGGGADAQLAASDTSSGGTNGDPVDTGSTGAPPAPPARPRAALPSYWYETDFSAWIGKRWQDVSLFQYMDVPPRGLAEGTRFVVFYNRTCDHCEEMFELDLATDAGLAAQVTAVEVPAGTDVMTSPDGWPLPKTACELLSLPLGPDWIMTTPLALRIVDGVVRCAVEGSHFECMGLEPREHDE